MAERELVGRRAGAVEEGNETPGSEANAKILRFTLGCYTAVV